MDIGEASKSEMPMSTDNKKSFKIASFLQPKKKQTSKTENF
jgi:hypothetical protein